eukprot:s7260_g2.t1
MHGTRAGEDPIVAHTTGHTHDCVDSWSWSRPVGLTRACAIGTFFTSRPVQALPSMSDITHALTVIAAMKTEESLQRSAPPRSLSLSLLNDTSPMMHLNVMMHLRMLQCRMTLAQDWTKA